MEEDETAPMQRPGGRPSPGAGKTVDATDTTEPPEMDETKPSPAKRPGARSMERDPMGDMADEDAPSDDAKNPPGKNPAMASTDTPSKGAPQAADGDGDDAKAGPIIDAAVEKAFAALVDSDFEAADAALEPARKATKDRAEAERVDGWQLLVEYAKGFEDYRMQAIAAVKGGDEYDVPRSKGEGEMRVGIVDVADGNMSFRVEGQTLSKPLDKLPSNLLMAILKKWFDDNPANNLYLGAYHLTRPEPDLATAERLWSTAAVRGADAAPLLPLLDEPVIRRAAAGE